MSKIVIQHYINTSLKSLPKSVTKRNEEYVPVYISIYFDYKRFTFKSKFYRFLEPKLDLHKYLYYENYVPKSHCKGKKIVNEFLKKDLERELNFVKLIIDKNPILIQSYNNFNLFDSHFEAGILSAIKKLSNSLFTDENIGLKKIFLNFGLFNLFELLNKDLDILSNDLVILDSIKEIMGLKSNKKNDLSYDEVMGINGNITPMLEILKTVKEYSIKWRTDNGFSISNIPITILELSENKIQEDFKRYCKAKSVSEIAQNYILTNL